MVIVSDILVLNFIVVEVVIIIGRKKKVLLLIILRMMRVDEFFLKMLVIFSIIVSSFIIELLMMVGINGDMVLINVFSILVLICFKVILFFWGNVFVSNVFLGNNLSILVKV